MKTTAGRVVAGGSRIQVIEKGNQSNQGRGDPMEGGMD